MSKEDDHHEVDKKEKFRTPPLVQQPHFAYQQQQYYYYYQTPVYPSGMAASPPPNAFSYNSEMNLMSPLQFNYLPASPSQNYNPYGQQTYGYQYSPKGKYNDSYSPKKHGNGIHSKKANQGWVTSPRKQGMNKNYKLKPPYTRSPGEKTKKQTNSPVKYNNRGSKLNEGKQTKMPPLTSNTNIKKNFVIKKLDAYDDYEKELNSYASIAQEGKNHSFVTKINTSNCLEKNCLNLLKKPVYDILYELDMGKIISLSDDIKSERTIEMDNDVDRLILQEINSLDDKHLDDFFTYLGESLQKSNEENDMSAMDSSESSMNKSMSSGRMIVLKKSTNFFVSSKGQDPNLSINADRRSSYSSKSGSINNATNVASNKTRELRRTLNLGTSSLQNKDDFKTTTTSLFGDIGDSSFVKSSKSNNFNKLIETSPKKLAMNQNKNNEISPTKKSRSLMSKGATLLKPDADISLESFDEMNQLGSKYSTNGLGLLRQPSVIDYSEKEPRQDKSPAQGNGNTSVLDLSFDGKAMNKSDLFKLIDSFEM